MTLKQLHKRRYEAILRRRKNRKKLGLSKKEVLRQFGPECATIAACNERIRNLMGPLYGLTPAERERKMDTFKGGN